MESVKPAISIISACGQSPHSRYERIEYSKAIGTIELAGNDYYFLAAQGLDFDATVPDPSIGRMPGIAALECAQVGILG